jgi:hypothetical protein
MNELIMRRREMNAKKIWNIIEFEDPLVKEICVSNWGGVNGAGGVPGVAGEITMEQAAKVTSILTKFNGTAITKFNELYYFENAQVPGNAFQNCSSLIEVSLPKKMTALPGGTSSFKNNKNTVIYFPEGYEVLKYSTFGAGCNNVKLILPTTFSTIGSSTLFSGSNYVIVLKNPQPITTNYTHLTGNAVAKIYVPDAALELYKSTWTSGASKIYPLSDYEGSIVSPVW